MRCLEISHRRPGARAAQPPAVNLPEFSALVCTWPGGEAAAGGGALAPQLSRTDCRQTRVTPFSKGQGLRGAAKTHLGEQRLLSWAPYPQIAHVPHPCVSARTGTLQDSQPVCGSPQSLLHVFPYLQESGYVGRPPRGPCWKVQNLGGGCSVPERTKVLHLVPWVPPKQSLYLPEP